MDEFEPSVSNNNRKWLHSLIWEIEQLFFKWIRADKHFRKTDDYQESRSSRSISDKNGVCFSTYPDSLESGDESLSSPEKKTENESNRSRKQVSKPDDMRTSSPGTGTSYVHSNNPVFRVLDELSDVVDRHKNESSERWHYEIPSKEKILNVHENIFEFLCQEVLECVDGESYTSNEVQDESRHKLKDMGEDSSNIEIRELKRHVNELKEKLGQCTKSHEMRENTYKNRIQELQDRNDYLETRVNDAEEIVMKTEQDLRKALLELERNARLADKLTKTEEAPMEAKEKLRKTMVDLGSVSVENRMIKRKLPGLSQTHDVCTQTTDVPSPRLSSRTGEPPSAEALQQNQKEREDDVKDLTASDQPEEAVGSSVQVSREESSGREEINLYNRPTTAVARSVYNNYKLLLLTISQWLLSDDVVKLKEWASGSFSVNVAQDVDEVFRELDRKGAISSSNLDTLRAFFERILRVDLMHLIDCFLRGDYGLLRATNSTDNARKISRRSGGTRSISPQKTTGNPSPQALTRSNSVIERPGYSSHSSELVNARNSFLAPRPAVKNMVPNSSSRASNVRNHGVFQDDAVVVTDGAGRQADDDNVAPYSNEELDALLPNENFPHVNNDPQLNNDSGLEAAIPPEEGFDLLYPGINEALDVDVPEIRNFDEWFLVVPCAHEDLELESLDNSGQ